MAHTSSYDDYFNNKYLYPPHSFIVLRTLNVVCSLLSLLGCITTISVYVLLRWLYKYKASRVSLRCVFFSTIMNMGNAICDMSFAFIPDTSSACYPLAIVNNYCAVASSAFLTLIGVNLLVVFVFQLKHKKYHEYIYYIFALLYSVVSLALPIYYVQAPCAPEGENHTCWFTIYYASSYCGEAVWTWIYSFLMFLVLCSAICSVIAIVKLRRESNIIAGDTYQRHKKDVKKRTSMVAKVVLRCVIYLMVPLVCYLCGFIVQTIVLRGLDPPFGLAFASVFLRGLMGLFVTIIFFSDPFVTTLVKSKVRGIIQKYVHEYYEIDVSDDGSDDGSGDHDRHRCFYSILSYMRRLTAMVPYVSCDEDSSYTYVKKRRRAVRCTSTQYPMQTATSAALSPSTRSPEQLLLPEPSRSHTVDRSSSSSLGRTSSALSTHSAPRKFQSFSAASYDRRPILGFDPLDANRIYVPYTHPRFASMVHCILVRIFQVRPTEGEEQYTYQNTPDMMEGSTGESEDYDDSMYVNEAATQGLSLPRRPEAAVFIPREPTVSCDSLEQQQARIRQEQKRMSSIFLDEPISIAVDRKGSDTSTLLRDTSSPEPIKEP
ncbi:hypothetical protein BCR43DRAFT_564967 [Syncephalastrum racemosum]|uniref:Uncharacterized protein n=1 Tax=Syncephalastrum racemosum TaxID=13706 RepID=A0A1X2H817_SYNRA|nr:hypothetical protein BCR43DRAFT_564967 [Syncephalastrum racemosum]